MKTSIKGIVFDLDGTLVHSTIDFRKMKPRMIEYLASQGADKEQLSPRDLNVVIISKGERMLREKGIPEEEIKRILEHMEEIMNETEMESVAETKPI